MKKLFDNNIDKPYAVCSYTNKIFAGTLDECWAYLLEHYAAFTVAQLNEQHIRIVKPYEHSQTRADWS